LARYTGPMKSYLSLSLSLLTAALLSGCAGGLERARQAAYDDYWQCVSHAVQPLILGSPLSAGASVQTAQTRCAGSWNRFEAQQIALVQSRLRRDNADLGNRLGQEQARVWRQRATRALTDYVIEQRRR